MKFLVMSSPKDTAFNLPVPVFKKLLEENIAWFNQKKQSGVILEMYSLAGWDRYAMICQLESAEDIDRMMRQMPVTAYMHIETYPLSEWEETAKANMAAAEAALKRMT